MTIRQYQTGKFVYQSSVIIVRHGHFFLFFMFASHGVNSPPPPILLGLIVATLAGQHLVNTAL